MELCCVGPLLGGGTLAWLSPLFNWILFFLFALLIYLHHPFVLLYLIWLLYHRIGRYDNSMLHHDNNFVPQITIHSYGKSRYFFFAILRLPYIYKSWTSSYPNNNIPTLVSHVCGLKRVEYTRGYVTLSTLELQSSDCNFTLLPLT